MIPSPDTSFRDGFIAADKHHHGLGRLRGWIMRFHDHPIFAFVRDFGDKTNNGVSLYFPDIMKHFTRIFLALAVFACAQVHAQKFPGLALTPPMGWNSWNKFAGNINEDLIRQTANAMATNGMRDAGYVYIVVDDCWEAKERDKQGNIVADPDKFPSGMKALGDYLHSKGFRFGIHNCAGTKTCAGFPRRTGP